VCCVCVRVLRVLGVLCWGRAERAREEVTEEYLRQRQAKRAAEDAALSKETAASS
jgi:hypothetical protein